ncbi:MAG TPA: LysR family transcriptional regulator, partial [Candidatus Nanopelagicales bacterium]|nr:LysR family transcriptional regulator [Candidatus Nanopelagicales bacterium]
PDLGILHALDALLQEGSVTGAAQRVGLSTPAMSHALARLREQLGDPLLVRAGRAMVLTPRAEALRPRVRDLVAAAEQALAPEVPFAPRELERAFIVHATDHVLTVLGPALDRLAREEAPRLDLRFVPTAISDPEALREGEADLAVGIYGELPPELRTRVLFTDRFVCVVRDDHPGVGKRLSVERFVALEHVQIAPRGRPGGYIDDLLAERGLSRRVARAVPYTLAALLLVARTDYVLTVSERIARAFAPSFGLRVLDPPLPLRPYALSLLWHPRFDGDAAHRFLRDLFLRAAEASAADVHQGARTRLDPTDPTGQRAPGQRRRRG